MTAENGGTKPEEPSGSGRTFDLNRPDDVAALTAWVDDLTQNSGKFNTSVLLPQFSALAARLLRSSEDLAPLSFSLAQLFWRVVGDDRLAATLWTRAIRRVPRHFDLEDPGQVLDILTAVRSKAPVAERGQLRSYFDSANRAISSHHQSCWQLVNAAAKTALSFDQSGQESCRIIARFLLAQPGDLRALCELAIYKVCYQGRSEYDPRAAHEAMVSQNSEDPFSSGIRTILLRRYAMVFFAMGDLQSGWTYVGEYLHSAFDLVDTPELKSAKTMRRWRGEPIRGKSVFLFHGLDAVGELYFFGRFVGTFRRRAERVVLSCDPRNLALFRRSFGAEGVEVVDKNRLAASHRCDFAAQPEESGQFLPTLDWDPEAPLLKAEPNRVAEFRRKYGQLFPGQLRIGLAWRTGTTTEASERNLFLEAFDAVLKTPGCQFFDLQYTPLHTDDGPPGLRASALFKDPEVDLLGDMDVVAAQVSALDLVIAVSGTTTLLAAALGVPTWVLVPRCFLGRMMPGFNGAPLGATTYGSAWFASMRIFRQQRARDWSEVIERIRTELVAMRSMKPAGNTLRT